VAPVINQNVERRPGAPLRFPRFVLHSACFIS
jgi:hypothetical protein